jgi:hypothetical protein
MNAAAILNKYRIFSKVDMLSSSQAMIAGPRTKYFITYIIAWDYKGEVKP